MRRIVLAMLLVVMLLPAVAAQGGKPAAPSLQELTKLVDQLRAGNASLRQQAAKRLAQLRDPRALPLLEPLCKLPKVSETACGILAQSGRDGVTVLLKFAGAKEGWLRMNVVKALDASSDPRALGALRKALMDADAGLRVAAVKALADRVDDPAILNALYARLKDTVPAVRDAALTALQELPDPRLIEPLTGWMKSPDPRKVQAAAMRLGTLTRLGNARALDALLMLAKDTRPWARLAAVQQAGGLADPRAADLCLAALRDTESVVRKAAASAAAVQVNDPRIVDALMALLRDADSGVRSLAAQSLGAVKDPRVVEALLASLTGADATSRPGIITGLGLTNDPQAIGALLTLLQGKGGDAPFIVKALSTCTDPRIADALLALLPQADGDLRSSLYAGLGRLRDPRAVAPLLGALIGEKNKALIMVALSALSMIGDPQAADGVMAFYQNAKDGDLQGMALQTLGALKDPRVFPLLLAGLDTIHLRRFAIAGLAAYGGPQAFDALLPMLGSQDKRTREQVLQAMSDIDDPRVVPLLIGALGLPNPWLRLAVAEGLQKFGPAAQAAAGPLITVMEQDPDVASRKRIADTLLAITGKALGQDPTKWRAWLQGK